MGLTAGELLIIYRKWKICDMILQKILFSSSDICLIVDCVIEEIMKLIV